MDHIPRAAIRNPVRFEMASVRTYLLSRLIRTHEKAAKGEIHKDAAPSYGIQVKIALGILEHTDPVPKAVVNADVHGDLVISWESPDASKSPTPLEPSSTSFTPPSLSNGRALPSSSATDDLANL